MDFSFIILPFLVMLIAIIIYFSMIFNRLQSLRNGAEATLSQIRVAMKKRLDTIEQLVESVKSYASFESQTMERITQIRSGLERAGPSDLQRIEAESRGVVGSIYAVAEGYPNLKTSESVLMAMNAI